MQIHLYHPSTNCVPHLSMVSFYQYFIYIAFIHFPWLFFDTNFRVQLVAEPEFKKKFEIYRTVKYMSYLTQRKLKKSSSPICIFFNNFKEVTPCKTKERNITLRPTVFSLKETSRCQSGINCTISTFRLYFITFRSLIALVLHFFEVFWE